MSEHSATATPHCPLSPLRKRKTTKGRSEWPQVHTHSSLEITLPLFHKGFISCLSSSCWETTHRTGLVLNALCHVRRTSLQGIVQTRESSAHLRVDHVLSADVPLLCGLFLPQRRSLLHPSFLLCSDFIRGSYNLEFIPSPSSFIIFASFQEHCGETCL